MDYAKYLRQEEHTERRFASQHNLFFWFLKMLSALLSPREFEIVHENRVQCPHSDVGSHSIYDGGEHLAMYKLCFLVRRYNDCHAPLQITSGNGTNRQ